MTITADQAKLIAQAEVRHAQESCPLREAVADLKQVATDMRKDNADHNRDHGHLLQEMGTKLATHSEGFRRQGDFNNHVTAAIAKHGADISAHRNASEAEDRVLHGRITGIIWWLLATCLASVGGLIGIIVILFQIFGR